MRTLIVFLLVCAGLTAQTQNPAYVAFRESTLAAAAEAITIQQPASPTRTVVFEAASVYCSVACVLTIERDGTAATATALTANAVASNTDAVTALAFRSSDAGTGTVLAKHSIAAGQTMAFDLKGMRLPRVAGSNVTLRIASITGDVRIAVKWTEAP